MNPVPALVMVPSARSTHSKHDRTDIYISFTDRKFHFSHFEYYAHLSPSFIRPFSIKSRKKLSTSSFFILMNLGNYDRIKLTILQMIMEGLRIQSGTRDHTVGLWQLSPELSPGKTTRKWPADKNDFEPRVVFPFKIQSKDDLVYRTAGDIYYL